MTFLMTNYVVDSMATSFGKHGKSGHAHVFAKICHVFTKSGHVFTKLRNTLHARLGGPRFE